MNIKIVDVPKAQPSLSRWVDLWIAIANNPGKAVRVEVPFDQQVNFKQAVYGRSRRLNKDGLKLSMLANSDASITVWSEPIVKEPANGAKS